MNRSEETQPWLASILFLYCILPMSELPSYANVASADASGSTDSNDSPPPVYADDFHFKSSINGKKLDHPLVKPDQVRAHIDLLSAFQFFRQSVESGSDLTRFPTWALNMSPPKRWICFVNLAVERFERFCAEIKYKPSLAFLEEDLPPLDVLMVWHAYLLVPGWYTEDCMRVPICFNLRLQSDIFSSSLIQLTQLVNLPPTEKRVSSWIEKTRTFFDPFEAAAQLTHREVTCPKCHYAQAIQFWDDTGTGYGEPGFKACCKNSTCSFVITKDALGFARFLRDLTSESKNESLGSLEAYLAGSIWTPTCAHNLNRARLTKTAILSLSTLSQHPIVPRLSTTAAHNASLIRQQGNMVVDKSKVLSKEEWRTKICENAKWSMDGIRTIICWRLKTIAEQLPDRIRGAYLDDRPFSIDLTGTTFRHSSFIDQLNKIGCLDTMKTTRMLESAISRYHAFLDLIASSSVEAFYIPTLDIDLIWHTHQLTTHGYAYDCERWVGRFVNHRDKVDEIFLADAFQKTCNAWQSRFHVPYVNCGCPVPPETVAQKLARRALPTAHTRLDLVCPNESAPASHPSDHNAVFFAHPSRRSQSEAARRKYQEAQLQARRKGKAIEGRENAVPHGTPFIRDLPESESDGGWHVIYT